MGTIMALCTLVGVWVASGDCQTAQAYAPFVQQLPPEHWALVRTVGLTTQGHGKMEYNGAWGIVLPEKAKFYHVAHEVGHVVFGQDGSRLQAQWDAELWDGDVPLGDLTSYPQRQLDKGKPAVARREDAAQSYAFYLQGRDVGKRRQAWLEANLPVLVGYRQ